MEVGRTERTSSWGIAIAGILILAPNVLIDNNHLDLFVLPSSVLLPFLKAFIDFEVTVRGDT